jgi:hypothetical protein
MKKVWVAPSLCIYLASLAAAHQPGEDSANIDLGKGKVTIVYGTPKLGDRNIDDMIQPGLAWRMGMNNPTTLETTVDLEFGGKRIVAGKYTMFARTDGKSAWMLLICSGVNPRFDPASLAAESPLQFKRNENPQDLLKITLGKTEDTATITIAWGTYRLLGAFKAA